VKEHKDYLNYLKEIGINKTGIKFEFTYNPSKLKNDLKLYIDEFNKIINLPLKVSPRKTSKGRGFRSTIHNVLLTEIILNSMNTIRRYLANKKHYNKLERKLANSFISKLLTRDGTLDIRTKNREYNFPSTRIKIVDQDLKYLEDYKSILNNVGFKARIIKKYTSVTAVASFKKLIYLYQIEAFKNTNNWNKLLTIMELYLKGRRLNTYYRFNDLKKLNKFTSLDINKIYNLSKGTGLDWLCNKEKEGFVIRNNTKIRPIKWELTEKARNLSKNITNWKKDLKKLKKEKQIQDPNILLESLKTKFSNL